MDALMSAVLAAPQWGRMEPGSKAERRLATRVALRDGDASIER